MTLRQYLMLNYMAGHTYTIPQAILFRQRTFGALCKYKWVDFNAATNRFYVTRLGHIELQTETAHPYHRQKTTGLMEFAEGVFASHVKKRQVNRITHNLIQMKKAG